MIAAQSHDGNRFPPRRGYGLVEMAVAGVLLMALVLITLQLVGWTARDRQAITRREAATRLAGTMMERILTRPFATISTEALQPAVADANRGQPPSAGTLHVEIIAAEPIDDHARKKVLVEVRWSAGSGSPVRLVAWTTDRRGTQP